MKNYTLILFAFVALPTLAQYTPQGITDLDNKSFQSMSEETSYIEIDVSRFHCDFNDFKILESIPEIIIEHPSSANFYSFYKSPYSSCSNALETARNYSQQGKLQGILTTKKRFNKEVRCVGGRWGTCYETGRVFQNIDYTINVFLLGKMVLEKEINIYHSGSDSTSDLPILSNGNDPNS